MKKVTLVALLATLSLSAPLALADARDLPDDTQLLWEVEESYGDTESQAVISVSGRQGSLRDAAYCSEFGSGKVARYPEGASCDPATYKGDFLVQFSSLQAPVCQEVTNNCLESVFAIDSLGNRVEGKFLGYVSQDKWVAANISLGNPLGAAAGIWQLPGVINSAGTDLYQVHLNMEGGIVSFRNGRQQDKFSLKDRQFNAAIRPVKATITENGVSKDRVCENCNELPADYSFGLSTVLPESIHTWYSGRLTGADVSYKKLDSTYYRITVTGKPVKIPVFKATISKGQASEQLLEQFHWCDEGAPACYGAYTNGYGNESNWTDFLEAWRPLVADSATASATVWTVRTVPVNFGAAGDLGFSSCASKNRAAGMVTTNALMYNGNVPSLEKGIFNYRVAGMHFEADQATEFLGRYEMVMDEQLARCMFKFPKVPLSATVTVFGDDGKRVVATSQVSSSRGKLRLSAYNFTFSEKSISVRIAPKGYSLCNKGKTTRFVKGSKCPAGFKRS